jgi:hypothetical protein
VTRSATVQLSVSVCEKLTTEGKCDVQKRGLETHEVVTPHPTPPRAPFSSESREGVRSAEVGCATFHSPPPFRQGSPRALLGATVPNPLASGAR